VHRYGKPQSGVAVYTVTAGRLTQEFVGASALTDAKRYAGSLRKTVSREYAKHEAAGRDAAFDWPTKVSIVSEDDRAVDARRMSLLDGTWSKAI
jgi:hypothetical protein